MAAVFSPMLENLEARLLMSHVHHAAKTQKNPKAFVQTNLVADVAGVAAATDPQLVNAWGLAAGGIGPFWVNANGSDLSRGIYNGGVTPPASLPQTITVPKPTGIVFNNSASFKFPDNGSGQNKTADYLIASENGKIYAWTAPTDGSATSAATMVIDNSSGGAIYTGLVIGRNFGQPLIYAANFGDGTVDVFDGSFNQLTNFSGNTVRPAFTDALIPAGYAPYNITTIGPNILVTYALRDAAGTGSVKAAGAGFVDLFSTQGQLLRRFDHHWKFNAPWGAAVAPSDFGKFANDILVGNFGDGTINAFNTNGKFLGTLTDVDNHVITIDGLWGLSVGNDGAAGGSKTLFFAAGPGGENHGLFGKIDFKRVKKTTT
jgi:uncharacterized protein (TIGR03118 family)